MTRLYVYKLTSDTGAAPCVCDGLLSLAICKPRIRASARVGDLLFGFAANSLHADNRLIYMARVTEALPDGAYYVEDRFRARPDCIYQRQGRAFVRRGDARYHLRPHDLEHDLGPAPAYPLARVLVSSDFRYFGAGGTAGYKLVAPRLKKTIESLTQGHRVNHGAELRDELLRLWEQRPANAPATPPPTEAGGCGVAVTRRGRGCGSRVA